MNADCTALTHDTVRAYRRHGCRCPDAVAARSAQRNAARARRPRPTWRGFVDEAAVLRAAAGERIRLRFGERRLVIVQLTRQGRSTKWIADLLDVSERTVTRHRRQVAS